ncbi:MAG TPA: hypothetical protein VFG07_07345 [Thermoplasmata archaeon]|nr:hypothetical protein [Thermoplasmata archaeon]
MSLAYDVLDRYLYKEDVQQLARDRGLPTNRPKDELIATLLGSGRFVPAEALRYLNKRELRQICREYLLPDEGGREVLFRRVLAAIFAGERTDLAEEVPDVDDEDSDEEETEPGNANMGEEENHRDKGGPGPPKRRTSLRWPASEAPVPRGENLEPGAALGFIRMPPAPWPTSNPSASYALAQDVSREHPDSTGPWAVASIVAGAIVAAGFYLLIPALGLGEGLAAAITLAIVVAAALMLTRQRWVPWLAGLGQSS